MPILVLFHPSSWYPGTVVSVKTCYGAKGDSVTRYLLVVEYDGDGAREGVEVVMTKQIERANRHTVFLGERREDPSGEDKSKQLPAPTAPPPSAAASSWHAAKAASYAASLAALKSTAVKGETPLEAWGLALVELGVVEKIVLDTAMAKLGLPSPALPAPSADDDMDLSAPDLTPAEQDLLSSISSTVALVSSLRKSASSSTAAPLAAQDTWATDPLSNFPIATQGAALQTIVDRTRQSAGDPTLPLEALLEQYNTFRPLPVSRLIEGLPNALTATPALQFSELSSPSKEEVRRKKKKEKRKKKKRKTYSRLTLLVGNAT
jgi:hypothetical protein